MSYKPSLNEVQALLACSALKPYQYFLNKVSDWGEVWSVRNDGGWALMGCEAGAELIPVWPAKAFAELCCTGALIHQRPEAIPTKDFVEKWLAGMQRDNRMAAVFPLPDCHAIATSPEKLSNDIKAYLDNIR